MREARRLPEGAIPYDKVFGLGDDEAVVDMLWLQDLTTATNMMQGKVVGSTHCSRPELFTPSLFGWQSRLDPFVSRVPVAIFHNQGTPTK